MRFLDRFLSQRKVETEIAPAFQGTTFPGEEIRGLYFPYANIQSAKTLKTAALYFDKIAVIDPRASFCGKSGRYRDLHSESSKYMGEISTLVQEGIIELIDPAKVIAEFGNEIMMGVIQDLQDAEFLRLCEPFAGSMWTLSSAKLPSEADKWLRNMLVNVPTLARESAFTEEFREQRYKFAERDPYFYELMMRRRMERRRFEERRPSRYDEEYEAFLLREMMFDEYRLVELPFAIGESLMTGHALAVAADAEFTPFCDESVHFEVLRLRARKLADSKPLKTVLHEYGYVKDVKADLAALDVISETIPNLESVHIDKILRFRKKRAQELNEFRVEMRKLITEIQSTPWDDEFQKHVSDVVDSKVKPALKQVESEIRGCRDAFWADAVKTVAQVGPLPIIGSVFTGVPPHIAVGLGATFAGLALILEQWAKMRNVKRNGWAFLLDAGAFAGRRVR